MHVLIVGSVQIGKSTLIRKLLRELGRPVGGFETRKEESLTCRDSGVPIYIYPAGGPYVQTEDNLIGISRDGQLQVFTGAFDRFAGEFMGKPEQAKESGWEKGAWERTVRGNIQKNPLEEGILLMDEIGHMETKSMAFCDGIMKALDGDRLVIAAVKNQQKPFLEQVRNHPNARCFYISEENRDKLYQEILDFIRSQEHEQKERLQ